MPFDWVHFLAYAITTAITPGPNCIMSMSNANRLGFRRSIGFNFGIWAGFSVMAVLATAFMSVLAAFITRIQLPMKIVGAGYMLYLAWKTFRATGQIEEKPVNASFLSGAMLQCVNPKLYLYLILSLELYIMPVYAGQTAHLAAFALLLAFIGFVCTVLWSTFGSACRWLFSKHARIINPVMALLLVYCAVSLFVS